MATTNDMTELTLGCCGITVWVPVEFDADKRKTGGTFYCPNGHPRAYVETTAQKLEKQLKATKEELEQKKGKLDAIKSGKCPFCWKTVNELSGHIKRCHQ